MSYEPKLVGFLCNWCSYAGADLAGTSRFEYPPSVRAIRVMCSGRVNREFILEALKLGEAHATLIRKRILQGDAQRLALLRKAWKKLMAQADFW